MKKILLVCSAGMSTSLLVNKMKKVAEEKGIECLIEAHGFSDVKRYDGEYDVCLVGPQIKYAAPQITKDLPSMPVAVIDMRVYGMADGDKALQQALDLMGE